MKKILTGIIAIAAFTFSASAQTQAADDNRSSRSQERRAYGDRIHPRLLEQLDLTSVQKDQIKTINEDYRTKMQELIKSDIAAEERKAKRTTYESDRTQKILAVLTPDQVKKLKELQATQKMGNDKGEYKEKTKNADGSETKIKVKND